MRPHLARCDLVTAVYKLFSSVLNRKLKMIQQQMYQDVSEMNDYQQQMMLCPVRVVYDTQMFVPPGDQIQQNQYVMNPQNPPPWIKNQVIYVQNVPNNYIPSYQQHIDQCQYQNYGYNMPQMLVQSPQDPRSIQIVPANLVPNISNINQRMVTPNMAPINNHVIVTEVQNPNMYTDTSIHPNQMTNNEINRLHELQNQSNGQLSQITQTETRISMQPMPIMANIQQRLPQFDQNTPIRQPHPQIASTNVQSNYVNMVTQKVPPINKTISPNYPITGNNQTIFRAIQPRPTQFNQPIQHAPSQNIVYMNSIRRNSPSNVVNTQNVQPNYVKIENIRKRKSESPDEIRNKVVVSNHNNVVVKQEPVAKPIGEIVPNSMAVLRSEQKIVVNSLQITPIDTQNAKIKEELAKPIRNISLMEPKQMIRKKMMNNIEAIQHLTNLNVQRDKLVRNTVFVQARGRVLNERVQGDVKSKIQLNDNKEDVKTQNLVDKKEKTDNIDKIVVEKNNSKTDNTEDIKTECTDNNKLNEEKNFLLTHVLDGYVIQESNVAFPIRRPLKEKTLHVNAEAIVPKTEPKEGLIEKKVDENERLMPSPQLKLKEDKEDMETKDQDNPFGRVDANLVKSWTVDQLVEHLQKFSWDETVTLLQEHEIDGESLFLVSKAQLMKIGICEEHATAVCDFIKR